MLNYSGEDGYSGVEVRVTPMRTEIIIRATRTREVLGKNGRRIHELTTLIQNRFGLDGRPAMTFQELGEMLGLSRERARQIEEEAMTRLRRRLARATGGGAPRNDRPGPPAQGRRIPVE